MSTNWALMAPLRIRAFRRMCVALFFFMMGYLVHVVASSWVILELTGSPFWVGLMVGAPTLPLLLLALPAGAIADLLDRRRVLMASSVLMLAASVAMAVLSMSDFLTPGRLLALELLLGVGMATFLPAWQAMVPAVVPTVLVPGAVALNLSIGASPPRSVRR